jgi:hypothetical protein
MQNCRHLYLPGRQTMSSPQKGPITEYMKSMFAYPLNPRRNKRFKNYSVMSSMKIMYCITLQHRIQLWKSRS